MTASDKGLVSMSSSQHPVFERAPQGVRTEPPAGRSLPDPRLGARTLVMVGLMGAGKTSIGRNLAQALRLPFRDTDEEIERAAGRSVADIFAEHGEAAFRDLERRVIARLLTQEAPHVLAFGGGAFLHPETRALAAAHAISVWIKADLEVLARRVARRNTRPLLIGKDPMQVLSAQAAARYAAYGEATLTVETGEIPMTAATEAVLTALARHVITPDSQAMSVGLDQDEV
jgi:shikimate kinase